MDPVLPLPHLTSLQLGGTHTHLTQCLHGSLHTPPCLYLILTLYTAPAKHATPHLLTPLLHMPAAHHHMPHHTHTDCCCFAHAWAFASFSSLPSSSLWLRQMPPLSLSFSFSFHTCPLPHHHGMAWHCVAGQWGRWCGGAWGGVGDG